MRVPTVHLNGTARADLLEGYKEAIRSLLDATKALQATCPNGRDYYPQSEYAIHQAMAEHSRRFYCIQMMIRDLEKIAESLL